MQATNHPLLVHERKHYSSEYQVRIFQSDHRRFQGIQGAPAVSVHKTWATHVSPANGAAANAVCSPLLTTTLSFVTHRAPLFYNSCLSATAFGCLWRRCHPKLKAAITYPLGSPIELNKHSPQALSRGTHVHHQVALVVSNIGDFLQRTKPLSFR